MELPSLTFVNLLRCPLTRLPLKAVAVDGFEEAGLAGKDTSGWSSALVRSDLRAVYPVRGGIPVLLAEELLPLDGEVPLCE